MAVSATEMERRAQDQASALRRRPSFEMVGGYYNGELTFQVDARTKTVKVTWEMAKTGLKASKKWTITGSILGFFGGLIAGGPPGGVTFGLAGGAAGAVARTAIYIYEIKRLDSKVDEVRVTAGKICKLIIERQAKEVEGQNEGDDRVVLDRVTEELMMEPVNLNCEGIPVHHIFDLMTISKIIVTQGRRAKCPICRTQLVQANFEYDLETKQRIQEVVTDAIRYLKNITISDPDVIDQIYEEKDRPDLLSEASQIVNKTRDETLSGAQAYILSSVVKKYAASWNGQMETIHRGILNSLLQKRDRNQISIEESSEKMGEAIDWYRASLIK